MNAPVQRMIAPSMAPRAMAALVPPERSEVPEEGESEPGSASEEGCDADESEGEEDVEVGSEVGSDDDLTDELGVEDGSKEEPEPVDGSEDLVRDGAILESADDCESDTPNITKFPE